jgi:cation transport regulator ChaB
MKLFNEIKDLPVEVRRLPYKAQEFYQEVSNNSYNRTNDTFVSNKVAWDSVKSKFTLVNGQYIAKAFMPDLYVFDLELSEEFIMKSEDGNYYMEGVLADILPDKLGWTFTAEALEDFATQINSGQIMGGISHQEYEDLLMKYAHLPNDEFIAKALSERKGILKTVKAIYEKGKLWIKAIVDKRYLNHVKKFKRMSIEAFVPNKNQDKKNKIYKKGKVLGLALSNTPVNPRAKVVKIE